MTSVTQEPATLAQVSWRDTADLALRHADVATKIVQFFLAGSVAIGGWVFSSEELRQSDLFGTSRFGWAILYTLMSAPLWLALLDLQRRINACYAHARRLVPEGSEELARPFEPRLVRFGLPIFVVAVDLLILIFR